MDNFLDSLNQIAKKTEEIGNEIYSSFEGDLNNDLEHMCKCFSKRQLAQLQSLILLEGNDDAILIARSMFEGLLYLSYSIKNREMCRRWRLFSCVGDIKRIEATDDTPPVEVVEQLKVLKPEIDSFFKKENGEYHINWYGNKTIKKIANSIDNQYLYLYKTYYCPMSEYHHWAPAAFGKRYRLERNEIFETNSEEVKLELIGALCMALSSAISTLKVSSKVFHGPNYKPEKVTELEKMMTELNGTVNRKINITSS
jgi:hypothetical protein